MEKLTENADKTKKSKRNKERKPKEGNGAAPIELDEKDLNKLITRHTEALKVIEQKKDVLASNQLSYLEYVEVQEEICRLVEFKDNVQYKINAIRKEFRKK